MAGKPIPLDEAAKMLGMTPEQLADHHARNEILDVRGTGSVRKFKLEELQRFADEQGIDLRQSTPDSGDVAESDSIEIEEDIFESDELVLEPEEGGSNALVSSSENTGSDVLAGKEAESKESGSDTGKMLGEDDDLLLSDDDLFDDGDLSLSDDGDMSLDSDSDLEDSDLVLDEDSSSEVALSSDDSGINLSPTDSGLSLEEESIEFSGSDIDSLELPEDDDMIEIEGEIADADSATVMRADEDFILTPVEEAMDDESSGSQVIDLESSEIYVDESSSGMFGDGESDEGLSSAPLVAEDAEMFEPEVGGAAGEPMAVGGGQQVTVVPESPYSVFNILSLLMVLFFVTVTAMIAVDVVRNLWQYEGEIGVTSTLTDFVIKMVGIDPNNPG